MFKNNISLSPTELIWVHFPILLSISSRPPCRVLRRTSCPQKPTFHHASSCWREGERNTPSFLVFLLSLSLSLSFHIAYSWVMDAVLQKWLAWDLFDLLCCSQPSFVVSQQSWFWAFFVSKFSNFTHPRSWRYITKRYPGPHPSRPSPQAGRQLRYLGHSWSKISISNLTRSIIVTCIYILPLIWAFLFRKFSNFTPPPPPPPQEEILCETINLTLQAESTVTASLRCKALKCGRFSFSHVHNVLNKWVVNKWGGNPKNEKHE